MVKSIAEALENPQGKEIIVDEDIAEKALIPLQRMLNFAAENQLKVKGNA